MVKAVALFLPFFVFSFVVCKPQPFADEKCGYDACHPIDPNKLNIHLVPHSHDDVGWKKTVDQYYYGNKIREQAGVRGVQYILDSVVQSLQENSDRRFIQVETAFFTQWWKHQDDATKAVVQELVDTGRLEFIGGAWSMNDEAATNYQAIIDQFTLGLRTLTDLLGDCAKPKIGWQIDPFGHTGEMANIFAQLGYDGFFFTRLDYRDIAERQKTKNTEFIWKGSANSDLNIFTSIIHRFYNAPDNFCWDVQCGDTPIVEDKDSPEYNVEERVEAFAAYAEEQAKYYKTNNVLITMGGDFTYQAAEMYYINMDRLIKGFQTSRDDINIIYSTPSCYVKAVNDMAASQNLTFSLNTNDFLPYANDAYSYWTGYYTSRPNSKRFERQGNNLLQVVNQLVTFGRARGKNFEDSVDKLKEVMGIMQHHDAITGTEKQHVADDYVKLLNDAMTRAEAGMDEIVADLLKKSTSIAPPVVEIQSCLLANASRCQPSTSQRFVVSVYNPLSREVSHYVRLPVTSAQYRVTAIDGSTVGSQVTPSIDSFENSQQVPETGSLYDLVFYAEDLPPMGLKYFYVIKEDTDVNKPGAVASVENKLILGTDTTGFEIDEDTGLLKAVTLNGATVNVKQQFMYYTSAAGDNKQPENRASGAYIFRPAASDREAKIVADTATTIVYSGDLVDEVHQTFSTWVKQVIRIYKQENHIEFDWVVGPVEFINDVGVEVISRFITDLETESAFYTDSNGRGLVKRTRNHRETYDYTNEEPVSGNYYPVTSRIVLKDETKKQELAILNDRAQGGSSLKDGEVELMVHRRLTHDDDFGVDEALDEYEFGKGVVVRGQHYLVLGTETGRSAAAQQHDVVQRKLLAPWTFIGDASSTENTIDNLARTIGPKFSGLTKSLPENVHILTLMSLTDDVLLLRLEHTFESGEDTELSNPVTVDLQGILTLYKITSIYETTLGANQNKADNQRLSWKIEETKNSHKANTPTQRALEDDLKIELNSHEIRTFIIGVEVEDKTGIGGSDGGTTEPDGASSIVNSHALIALLFAAVYILY